MNYVFIDYSALSIELTLFFVVAGLKELGIFDNVPKKIFVEKGSKQTKSSVTLTELFAKSQTKYHSLLIMYIMFAVMALFVALKVFPWQILLAITFLLTFLSDKKIFTKVKYKYYIIFALPVLAASFFIGEAFYNHSMVFIPVKVILGAVCLFFEIMHNKGTANPENENGDY